MHATDDIARSAPTVPAAGTATGAGGRDGDGFDVDPAALLGAAGVFDAESDALLAAVSRLHQTLGTLGRPWGTDEVGERFGAEYEPAAEQVVANLAALSAGSSRIAAALRAVAQSYDLADTFTVSAGASPTSGTPADR